MLNHNQTPKNKLADVEIHFEDGLLSGLKLVGFSVWTGKKSNLPTVIVPSRSFAIIGGVRYFELLRGSLDSGTGLAENEADNKIAIKRLKDYIRAEYFKIAPAPEKAGAK